MIPSLLQFIKTLWAALRAPTTAVTPQPAPPLPPPAAVVALHNPPVKTTVLEKDPLDHLIDALIMQESRGNVSARGDKNLPNPAYGCLQIRQPVLDDINRWWHTSYSTSMCMGTAGCELSRRICRTYVTIYGGKIGRTPTLQDYARIWNGGPLGYCKESTIKYWPEVQRFL